MIPSKRVQAAVAAARRALPLGIATCSVLGAGVCGFLLTDSAPAASEVPAALSLPAPPVNGIMGFVVQDFAPPFGPGMDACPKGTARHLKEVYLRTLPQPEQARLRLKENEKELTDRWHAYAFDGKGANICSQPDRFRHAAYPTVESKFGLGLNLDGAVDRTTSPSTVRPAVQGPADLSAL